MNTISFDNQTITPSKIICVGRNYVEHIHELGNEMPDAMVLFNKPNSAITNELHFIDDACRFEGEICFVVMDQKIAGVGFGLDLTKADLQNELKKRGLPWERAKAFDRSAVLSQMIPFDPDYAKQLKMILYHNDLLTQYATFDLMIYKPQEILDEIKTFMTLENGDIIMSGTPKGVGNYNKWDEFNGLIYLDETLILEARFKAI
jgi:2-keto-4-pentenoate hydratase/2-oxohepta-3-ene-1,7-dioic acid hydratase in catechol pathway